MPKERLVFSCIFDMDTQPNHMYQPVLTIRYNSENEERPIKVIVHHKWTVTEHSYPYNEGFKQKFEKSPRTVAKSLLEELLPAYEGKKVISEWHRSDLGTYIAFCKDHKAVLNEFFKK